MWLWTDLKTMYFKKTMYYYNITLLIIKHSFKQHNYKSDIIPLYENIDSLNTFFFQIFSFFFQFLLLTSFSSHFQWWPVLHRSPHLFHIPTYAPARWHFSHDRSTLCSCYYYYCYLPVFFSLPNHSLCTWGDPTVGKSRSSNRIYCGGCSGCTHLLIPKIRIHSDPL